MAFLQSHEGQRELMVPDIEQSGVVSGLIEVGSELEDSEGWIPLGAALKLVLSRKGVEVSDELERFEMKSPTELLAASRLFEIRAETAGIGGTRVFYRRAER